LQNNDYCRYVLTANIYQSLTFYPTHSLCWTAVSFIFGDLKIYWDRTKIFRLFTRSNSSKSLKMSYRYTQFSRLMLRNISCVNRSQSAANVWYVEKVLRGNKLFWATNCLKITTKNKNTYLGIAIILFLVVR